MTLTPISDARFYFLSACTMALAAAAAAAVMNAAHVSDSQSAMVLGFAGVMVTNALVAYRSAAAAEAAKAALAESAAQVALRAAEVAVKAEELRLSVSRSELARSAAEGAASDQLRQIITMGEKNQATGRAIHTLVNNQYGVALRANVRVAEELYRITGTPEHKAALDVAAALLREHAEHDAVGPALAIATVEALAVLACFAVLGRVLGLRNTRA